MRQIQADPARGLYTLESTGGIERGKRVWNIGDLRLVENDQAKNKEVNYNAKAFFCLFFCALEVMLRTLAKAGLHWVTDPEDDM